MHGPWADWYVLLNLYPTNNMTTFVNFFLNVTLFANMPIILPGLIYMDFGFICQDRLKGRPGMHQDRHVKCSHFGHLVR